jgi:hypothetical protein
VKIEWQIVPILITWLYSKHGICFTLRTFWFKGYVKLNNGKILFEYDASSFALKVIYAGKKPHPHLLLLLLFVNHIVFFIPTSLKFHFFSTWEHILFTWRKWVTASHPCILVIYVNWALTKYPLWTQKHTLWLHTN